MIGFRNYNPRSIIREYISQKITKIFLLATNPRIISYESSSGSSFTAARIAKVENFLTSHIFNPLNTPQFLPHEYPQQLVCRLCFAGTEHLISNLENSSLSALPRKATFSRYRNLPPSPYHRLTYRFWYGVQGSSWLLPGRGILRACRTRSALTGIDTPSGHI